MALKPPLDRVRDAHRAFDLWFLLEGSRVILAPDDLVKYALQAAFLAGVSHALAETHEDLEATVAEVRRRLQASP
jgi:hypothetical protein